MKSDIDKLNETYYHGKGKTGLEGESISVEHAASLFKAEERSGSLPFRMGLGGYTPKRYQWLMIQLKQSKFQKIC